MVRYLYFFKAVNAAILTSFIVRRVGIAVRVRYFPCQKTVSRTVTNTSGVIIGHQLGRLLIGVKFRVLLYIYAPIFGRCFCLSLFFLVYEDYCYYVRLIAKIVSPALGKKKFSKKKGLLVKL